MKIKQALRKVVYNILAGAQDQFIVYHIAYAVRLYSKLLR